MNLFNQAINFAVEKHKNQTRKIVSLPYILHPMEVSCIASTMTEDENVLVAAVLHDTIEDTDATREDILSMFGEQILKLVECETENKYTSESPKSTWQKRKEESLEILKNTDDISVKILWLSDKLSNIRSFYRSYLECGDELWNSLNENDPIKQKWYYTSVAEYTKELSDTAAYKEYVELLVKIFDEK